MAKSDGEVLATGIGCAGFIVAVAGGVAIGVAASSYGWRWGVVAWILSTLAGLFGTFGLMFLTLWNVPSN